MAFPALIDPTNFEVSGFNHEDPFVVKDKRWGPLAHESDLYTAVVDRDNDHVEMWKSSDGGNTWSEQDPLDHKVTAKFGFWEVEPCELIQHSNTAFDHLFYVVYLDTSANLRVAEFNANTDSWASTSPAGPSMASAGSFSDPAYETMWFAEARPVALNSTEIVVLYGIESGSSVNYTIYDPGSNQWQAVPVVVFSGANNYIPVGVVEGFFSGGGVDFIHFIAHDTTAGELRHRSLNSIDELSTDVKVADMPGGAEETGKVAAAGNDILVAYSGGSNSFWELYVARGDRRSQSPSFSEETVLFEPLFKYFNTFSQPVDAGGVQRVFYSKTDDGSSLEVLSYVEYNPATGLWGNGTNTEVTVHTHSDADTINEISARPIRPAGSSTEDFGVLYGYGDPFLGGPAADNNNLRYTQLTGGVVVPTEGAKNGIFDAPGGFIAF